MNSQGERQMKRLKLLPVLLLLFGLTGCIQKFSATEEQSDAIAEYMAGKLLKYDERYEQDIFLLEKLNVDTEVVTENDEISSVPDTNSTETANEIEKEYSISEVIGAKDFDIQYTGYVVAESYPQDSENSYFSLNSGNGNQLVVASFSAKNTSDKTKSLNLSKSNILYQLEMDEGTVYKPSLTLLENDLQYIIMDIPSGETKEVLLIFEVKTKEDMSKILLIISNDNKSVTFRVK